MKNRKTAAILAALTLFCTAFTACGNQTESLPDTKPDTTQPTAETTAPEETTESSAAESEAETTASAESDTTAASEETMAASETAAEETTAAPAATDAPVQSEAPTQAPTQPPTQAPTAPPAGFDADDLKFTFGGSSLTVGEDASGFIGAVPANSTESAPSCYGDGSDTNYYYTDFTLYIWDNGTTKFTYGIDIMGPGAATAEGITIGSTVDALIAAYGTGYTEEVMDYVYTVGECNMRFTISGGVVTYISYNYNL